MEAYPHKCLNRISATERFFAIKYIDLHWHIDRRTHRSDNSVTVTTEDNHHINFLLDDTLTLNIAMTKMALERIL